MSISSPLLCLILMIVWNTGIVTNAMTASERKSKLLFFSRKAVTKCLFSTDVPLGFYPRAARYLLWPIHSLAEATCQVRSTHRDVNALQAAFRWNEEFPSLPTPLWILQKEDQESTVGNHTERDRRSKLVKSISQ